MQFRERPLSYRTRLYDARHTRVAAWHWRRLNYPRADVQALPRCWVKFSQMLLEGGESLFGYVNCTFIRRLDERAVREGRFAENGLDPAPPKTSHPERSSPRPRTRSPAAARSDQLAHESCAVDTSRLLSCTQLAGRGVRPVRGLPRLLSALIRGRLGSGPSRH